MPLTMLMLGMVNGALRNQLSMDELLAVVWEVVDVLPERVTAESLAAVAEDEIIDEPSADDHDDTDWGVEVPNSTPSWVIDHLVGDVLEAFIDGDLSVSPSFYAVIDDIQSSRQLRECLISMAISWISLIDFCERNDLGPTFASQLDIIRMSSPEDYPDE